MSRQPNTMQFRPVIQVDTREQIPLDFSAFRIGTESATLPVGDYGVKGFSGVGKDMTEMAIERKSLSDLTSTLGRGRERFMHEIKRARAYKFFGLVIESTRLEIAGGHYRSKIKPTSVLGSLESLQVNYDVHVYFCGSAEGAAERVYTLVYYFWQRQMKQLLQIQRQIKKGE